MASQEKSLLDLPVPELSIPALIARLDTGRYVTEVTPADLQQSGLETYTHRCFLLELPAELRLMIYSFILEPLDLTPISVRSSHNTDNVSNIVVKFFIQTAPLLRTSRTIRQEAFPPYFANQQVELKIPLCCKHCWTGDHALDFGPFKEYLDLIKILKFDISTGARYTVNLTDPDVECTEVNMSNTVFDRSCCSTKRVKRWNLRLYRSEICRCIEGIINTDRSIRGTEARLDAAGLGAIVSMLIKEDLDRSFPGAIMPW